VPLSLVSRLEEIPRSSIERAGGYEVVQYRDRILPLVPLQSVLEPGTPVSALQADPAQVIVFNDGERSLGIVVDQVLDIAEEVVSVRRRTGRAGLLGSGVVGKLVADFLDLHYVIRTAAEDWFRQSGQPERSGRILIADASSFSRGLIRGGLDMAGFTVLEASNRDEALGALERHSVDIVVAALDLPPNGCASLVEAMRRRPEWGRIPVLEREREAMLESIANLAAAVEKELQPA
jgi:two-component system chemotaxis sensor kinase CheA